MGDTRDQRGDLLYNVRIIKTYVEYLEKYYPYVSVDEVLGHVGMERSHLEDPGFWYDQDTADRFHDLVRKRTRNPRISREAGRFVVSSKAYKVIREYIQGFITPEIAYKLLPRIHAKVTRSSQLDVETLGRSKMLVVTRPHRGVHEKPYQCENRIGQFEAMAKLFTGEYAHIEHPECIHRGDESCRYIVTWREPLFLRLKRYINYLLFGGIVAFAVAWSVLPEGYGLMKPFELFVALVLALSILRLRLENTEYRKRLREQSLTAEMLIAESNARYNDSLLIQEIGEAISGTLDIDMLLESVVNIMKNRLDFDRGAVMLANEDKSLLEYRAGYGLTAEQEEFLKATSLHLDNPASKGPLVVCFRERRPLLIEDAHEITKDLSERSQELLMLSESSSFICVPIVFEQEPLGILVVDRTFRQTPLRQNDVKLLLGIAPQIAICINNARTFERLQESEEKYRDLVESAASIILRISTEGKITFANRFACEFYGYEEDEMIGQDVVGFMIPRRDSSGRDMAEIVGRFLAEPVLAAGVENENIRRNGERVWVSWSMRPVRGKGGAINEILCVGNDVTARKAAEQEKRQLEVQLVRSQKMEAIGNLAGGVAHDLNNILSGITGYPELLLMELPEGSPLRKVALTIKKSGEKAAAMVQDLLTLARRGVGKSGVVDINRVVSDYLESPEFQKLKEYHPGVSFKVDLQETVGLIAGSELHLGKTLMNLVSNAAEAIPSGGEVTIRTSTRRLDQPLKGFDTVGPGVYTVLTVEDTGMGITEEDQKKIFEPFFTKKVMGRSGTGLGMTVVWTTVKDHKGHIDIVSAPGEGTRIDLYFPVTTEKAVHSQDSAPITDFAGTESILVVDDVEDQRELVKNILMRLGYTVHTVSTGEDAVEFVSRRRCDLVVLDMILGPGMDGLDTYRKIVEATGPMKAVIVSGFSENERVKAARELGVGRYVHKPYTLEALARAIREELDAKPKGQA